MFNATPSNKGAYFIDPNPHEGWKLANISLPWKSEISYNS